MKGLKYLLTAVFLLLTLSALIVSPLRAAQITATPVPMNSTTPVSVSSQDVVITSPLIVSELHGPVEVRGTANLPDMRNYFLETRALNDDASILPDDVPWIPATLPASMPVQNGLLAIWDTTLVPDGLYELRLTVTTDNALSIQYVVMPLRVNNEAYLP